MEVGQDILSEYQTKCSCSQILAGERMFIWPFHRRSGHVLSETCDGIGVEIAGSRMAADTLVETNALRSKVIEEISPFENKLDDLILSELAQNPFQHTIQK